MMGWRNDTVRAYAALGDADSALPRIRWLLANDHSVAGWVLTPAILRLDPIWDKIRTDPRFLALAQSSSPLVEGSPSAAGGSRSGIAGLVRATGGRREARLGQERSTHGGSAGPLRKGRLPPRGSCAGRGPGAPRHRARAGFCCGLGSARGCPGRVAPALLGRQREAPARHADFRQSRAHPGSERTRGADRPRSSPEQPEGLHQAEAVLRRAIVAHPQHVRMKATLAYILASNGTRAQVEESRALLRS